MRSKISVDVPAVTGEMQQFSMLGGELKAESGRGWSVQLTFMPGRLSTS